METNPKAFDAVAESRQWREATSRKLDAMSREERITYLNHARERYLAERKGPAALSAYGNAPVESCVLREEPPKP
jgi:hypothetical protein